MYLRCLKDSQKDVSFEMFLRGLWDVSLNGDLTETSQRHIVPADILKPIDLRQLRKQKANLYFKEVIIINKEVCSLLIELIGKTCT